MILFLLQRSTKVFNINIAGLFVGSLEGAATVRDMCNKYNVFDMSICIQIFFEIMELKQRFVWYFTINLIVRYFIINSIKCVTK